MERNVKRGILDQQSNYEQVRLTNMDARNQGLGSTNQRSFHDPSSNISTNIRPPEYNMLVVASPGHNYSIQTGEEFALEFMRERVNAKHHFIPTNSPDPGVSTGYMDLKGILGIPHASSESGSNIAMLNPVEKDHVQHFERGGSSHEEKSSYNSMRFVPRASSRNDVSRLHGFTSSGASDSSSRKVKFLCSFGGKVMPRPSDGKLRYVGGETRIIRITKDISWPNLLQKTSTIYDQVHTIKYQLPGEDLDALVSVACDEDLQNMMEECNVPENGGSTKPRMFLFSISDLEDSQIGVGSAEGGSEIEYVIAVNGMDFSSRRNSTPLAHTSGNNLDELLALNVGSESGQVAPELSDNMKSSLTIAAPSFSQSSQTIWTNSSSGFKSSLQPSSGQKLQQGELGPSQLSSFHPMQSFPEKTGKTSVSSSIQSQHDYVLNTNTTPVENVPSMPIEGYVNQHSVLATDYPVSGFRTQDSDASLKDGKITETSTSKLSEPDEIQSLEKEVSFKDAQMKRESSLPKIDETNESQNFEHERVVSSNLNDASVLNYNSKGMQVINSDTDVGSSLMLMKSNKLQDPASESVPLEASNEGNKRTEDDKFSSDGLPTSGFGASEADETGFSYLEPILPQRVFHSERIPREQAELNRLSKSDDSFGSQFLRTQGNSDYSQTIIESAETLLDGNGTLQSEQFVSSSKLPRGNHQTIEDGLEPLEKYKTSADKNSKTTNISGEHDGSEVSDMSNIKSPSACRKEAEGLAHLMASEEVYDKHKEESLMGPLESGWIDGSTHKNHGNETQEQAEPSSLTENPGKNVTQVEPGVGIGTSEHGDILIDINDRFPRDFLSDIFSKARNSENISGINPLHGNGAGLSVNVENHEPKRWSYFRNLAQEEFVGRDVSLMDQDHPGFSSSLGNVEEGGTMNRYPLLNSDVGAIYQRDSPINFGNNNQQESRLLTGPGTTTNLYTEYDSSKLKGNESMQLDEPSSKSPQAENVDAKLDIQDIGVPLDFYLEDFDISTLQIIKNEDLEEQRELGSGTFGTVYHGKWRGTDVAIKRIKKSCFTCRSSEQERLTVEFWREAEILSKLHHPNVVAFYGVVQDGPGGTLATVTEFMVNGSLRNVLISKDRYLDRRKRLIIAMDAAFGMEYLHSKNIVHFDLKCDNLLVNLKDPFRPICKVGDFGLSKIKRNTLVTGGVRGTLPWMAPELLNGSSSKVSEKEA
ncbi:serine/threonine-protein kinase STE20 isoform X2 [Benincasa hispida]|uniref:serine/threonine-protein kinase STE20 isoform X2 n=1 Tax=Benincasa hispida TaxID=102211 RepID=UPI00190166B9|nr:serine/threonine-protein kinase STE20 isoform X2 [Benincasa hispida]